jgi:hypothetical protein
MRADAVKARAVAFASEAAALTMAISVNQGPLAGTAATQMMRRCKKKLKFAAKRVAKAKKLEHQVVVAEATVAAETRRKRAKDADERRTDVLADMKRAPLMKAILNSPWRWDERDRDADAASSSMPPLRRLRSPHLRRRRSPIPQPKKMPRRPPTPQPLAADGATDSDDGCDYSRW